jgi:DMSO/TMAO reductase YedYZ molybdopterin-dependent catalytic subunit
VPRPDLRLRVHGLVERELDLSPTTLRYGFPEREELPDLTTFH